MQLHDSRLRNIDRSAVNELLDDKLCRQDADQRHVVFRADGRSRASLLDQLGHGRRIEQSRRSD